MENCHPIWRTLLFLYLLLIIVGDGIAGLLVLFNNSVFFGLWLIVMSCSAIAILDLRKWGFLLYSGMATIAFVVFYFIYHKDAFGTLMSPLILYCLLVGGSPRDVWKELK